VVFYWTCFVPHYLPIYPGLPETISNLTLASFHIHSGSLFAYRVLWHGIRSFLNPILDRELYLFLRFISLNALRICRIMSDIPLAHFSIYFPQLELLGLEFYHAYEENEYRDAFLGFRNLTSFSFHEDYMGLSSENPESRDGLFPFSSTQSVTSLSLGFEIHGPERSTNGVNLFADLSRVDEFLNLRHLQIEPLDDKVCDIFAAIYNFSLESFSTTINKYHSTVDCAKVFSLLSSPFLPESSASRFLFSQSICKSIRHPLGNRITSADLETLKLKMAWDGEWEAKFSRLCR